MITLDTLRCLSACEPALAAFARAFPDGAPSWHAVADHAACRPEWRGWVATYAPGLTLAEREALADRTDDPPFWRGSIAAKADGLTLAERLDLAERTDNPPVWRGRIAFYAAGLTAAERLDLAARSNNPPVWRGYITNRYQPEEAELVAFWLQGR